MNPEVITLIATLDCNLNCPFCRHRELTEQFGRPSVFMPVDTAKKSYNGIGILPISLLPVVNQC